MKCKMKENFLVKFTSFYSSFWTSTYVKFCQRSLEDIFKESELWKLLIL